MSSSGFVVNYGEGKSTLLFGLEGKGKGSVQAELADMKGQFQVSSIGKCVYMANVCKHLGSMIHVSRTMTAELMHRHRSQLGVLGALKRAVFKTITTWTWLISTSFGLPTVTVGSCSMVPCGLGFRVVTCGSWKLLTWPQCGLRWGIDVRRRMMCVPGPPMS
eukprot:6244783-Pyramimonas_sp.AAC.1